MDLLLKNIQNLNININENKNYIYYNEIINKNGERYNYLINNNISLDNFSSHSPSCLNLYNVFDCLNITENDSILDIGSGKGFALFIFTLFKFKKIGGIEINKIDYDICQENINKLELNNRISIINSDILEFNNFSDYNYFYFYNPFNEEIFNKIVETISNLNNSPTIIYKNIHEQDIAILEKNNFNLSKIIKGEERDYHIYSMRYNLQASN
jgi:16S rRNA G966 N2-methylase RsmD